MKNGYTKIHCDFENLPWLTNPRKKLELEAVALGLINLPPNEGYTFTHEHREQEEVYIVISGNGCILIDVELIEISKGDIIRISPSCRRALKAHESGLFIICTGGIPTGFPKNPGARYQIDDGIPHYDDIPPWYRGDITVARKNATLKKRLSKNRANGG